MDFTLEAIKTFFEQENLDMKCLDTQFSLLIEKDKISGDRIYLQISYDCVDTKTGEKETYKGRKFYLSSYMTPDEVMKTAYSAFEMAIKYEVMEGFKIRGLPLFNPHTPYTEIIKLSNIEKTRTHA